MEIALGVLLGLVGIALAALAAYLVARRRPRTACPPDAGDDLPGFLESPPGTAPAAPSTGWAVLAPPPARAVTPARGRDSRLVPAALVAVAVLLIALTVALLTGRDGPRTHPTRGVSAQLSFQGVVLERHAVGITATYPRLEVTSDGGRSTAHLELPTFHCLTDGAPEDPVTAGCRRAPTEYADLDSPALSVTGSGNRLRLSGDFPAVLRPVGGPPEETGRVYPIEVSAVSRAGTVAGTLHLGDERTETTADPAVNVLRRGS